MKKSIVVISLAVLLGSLSPQLAGRANAQVLSLTSPATVETVPSKVTYDSFFSPTYHTTAYGGGGYLIDGGGTGVTDAFTIDMTPYAGLTLLSLSVTYYYVYSVANAQTGSVAAFSYGAFNDSSTYDSYIAGKTSTTENPFTYSTSAANGVFSITLSGFQTDANAAIQAGKNLTVNFFADAPGFGALGGNSGNYLIAVGSGDDPLVSATAIVPEPSTWGSLVLGFMVLGVTTVLRLRRV